MAKSGYITKENLRYVSPEEIHKHALYVPKHVLGRTSNASVFQGEAEMWSLVEEIEEKDPNGGIAHAIAAGYRE